MLGCSKITLTIANIKPDQRQISDKDAAVVDNGVYTVRCDEGELKTVPETNYNNGDKKSVASVEKNIPWCETQVATQLLHYLTLVILGFLVWALLWCDWSVWWGWGGQWFRLVSVVAVAWGAGLLLQELTTLPPLLAALLTGITAKHLGILDMTEYPHIDITMRKVFPVVVLGKISLAWDTNYMRQNWLRVGCLGCLPWTAEVAAVATCAHLLIGFPWAWGILLGSIYASVTCAIVMEPVKRIAANVGGKQNWPQLLCTSWGVDTMLSVGVFGIVTSFLFYETSETFKYTKVIVTIPLAIVLGVCWGTLADWIPNKRDPYVAELRVLFVLIFGLTVNFLTLQYGWGGAGGVAVLACNATAANRWARQGWQLNKNPAATAYRVLWSALEPTLFAFTGTFFVIESSLWEIMLIGLGMLAICLTIRLTVATIVCWDMTIKERLFICCTWIPKSIVEAVLCPLAMVTLIISGNEHSEYMVYARNLMRLIVEAILITTPLAFLLTSHLGPILLKKRNLDIEDDTSSQRRRSIKDIQKEERSIKL